MRRIYEWAKNIISKVTPDIFDTIVTGFISIVVAIIGWIITVKTVSKQINKQHLANLRLENERIKKDLEVKCTEQGLALLFTAQREILETTLYLNRLPSSLRSSYKLQDDFPDSIVGSLFASEDWNEPVRKIIDMHSKMGESITSFFYFFDAHYLILWNFIEMKDEIISLNSQLKGRITNITNTISEIYYGYYKQNLRVSNEKLDEFENSIKLINDDCYTLISYLEDFITGLQNTFLSEIFNGRQRPNRKPLDSKFIVLKPKNEVS